MSQLAISSVPGFNDLADSAIAGDVPLTDDSMTKISHNAKFGTVRCEIIFMGFYGDGDTVPTPVSPVDGYSYSRSECQFWWMIYSNRSRAQPYTAGQQYPPPQSTSQPQNNLYNFPGGWNIDDLTGNVHLQTSYYSGGGAEVVTNDGIIKVQCVAQRSSLNTESGTGGGGGGVTLVPNEFSGTTSSTTLTGITDHAPIIPGTFQLWIGGLGGFGNPGITGTDDGVGGWELGPHGALGSGTIDYTTGVYTGTIDASLIGGEQVYVSYSY